MTRTGGGRVWRRARVQRHRATTATLAAAYPFLAEPGLGTAGTYIGRDLFGGSFCFDPFELYAAGALTNPNLLVTGAVGSGKSALVKTLLYRQAEFGRTAFVADPKGEYTALAHAIGAPVIRLAPGGRSRLNPLDPLPATGTDGDDAATQARLRLVAALAGTALGRPLRPVEHAAATLALAAVTPADPHADPPVLPQLVDALLAPSKDAAASVRMTPAQLLDASRDLALVLHRMCAGDLAGMFDGPTSTDATLTDRSGGIDPAARLVVLDLSAVHAAHRDALPLVMTCATAWLQAAVTRTRATGRYVVLDEAWTLLDQPSTARWLQQSYKLARAHGVANLAVLHRFSDLRAAGDAGTATAALAHGLLADTGVRVVYAQPASELDDATTLLGLTPTERSLLPHLRQGTALWKVGTRSFVVEHRRSPQEAELTDTDTAITAHTSREHPR